MGTHRQPVLQAVCCFILRLCILTSCAAISTFDCSFDESTVFALRDEGRFEIAGLFPNATWQPLFQLEVGAGLVNACGVNPQDSILYCIVTYGSDVFVARFARNQSEYVARLPNGTSVRSVAFRSDGALYVAGNTSISSLDGIASLSGFDAVPSNQTWSALVSHGIEPTEVGGIVAYTADLDGSGMRTYVATLVPSGLLLWREGSGFQSFAIEGIPSGTYESAWQFGSRVFFASSKNETVIVEVFLSSLDFSSMTVLAKGFLALEGFQNLLGGISCPSSSPSFPYTCSALPPGLLPATAIQDCGLDNLNGSSCPFNCTNGFSHTGQLTCVNGLWLADGVDPPSCIAPCQNVPGAADVRTRATFVGYEFGYWASPTVPTTTTTSTAPCDTIQAQICLQSVMSITDIGLFCVALPSAIACLESVHCCADAQTPISGSIDSCLGVGLQVENACVDTLVDATCDVASATASCLAVVPETISSNESCHELARAPLCLFSKSCCPLLTNVDAHMSTCASMGIHIANPCNPEELPIANEGAIFRETCRSPRVPANDSVLEEDYVCKDGSFDLLGLHGSNLTCVDLPCRLNPHPGGAYDCVLEGRQVQLAEDSQGYLLVPVGAACSLRCHASYQQPVPTVELRCAYAESTYPDIIYLSERVSSSAVTQIVERSSSGSLEPLSTSQVCMDINCTSPTLDTLQANILSIDCEGISYNSTCSPVCAAGYEDSRQVLRCAADGRFHGFLSCLPLPCSGSPPWSAGEIPDEACVGQPHGAACDIRCSSGYDADPSAVQYICEAGDWRVNSTSPCQEKPCLKAPDIWNAEPSSLLSCQNRPGGFQCPVRCIEGYSLTDNVTCVRGSYLVGDLGCIHDSVVSTPTTVIGADLTMISASSGDGDQTTAVVSMRSWLMLDPSASSYPEELGAHVAADVMAANGTSALNATLSVWNAGLSSELSPAIAIRAAVGACLAVNAPAEAISALTELSYASLGVHESVTGITQSAMRVLSSNDTATLARILAAALDAVSSRALTQSMLADASSTARRLADVDSLAATVGDAIAGAASSFSGQLPLQELATELHRIHDGALLAGKSRLFADTCVAYAQTRWLGLQLSQLSVARQGLADVIRTVAAGAYSSLSDRSQSLVALGQQMGDFFTSFPVDAGVAAAHALGLDFGLSLVEALQVAAATAWHLHMGRCADTAFRCLPHRLIAIKESGRSMAKLMRWRPGLHQAEAGHLALLAAESSGIGTLEAKLAAAVGAMTVFGLKEQDLKLQAPGLGLALGEDIPADVARSAWMLGMSPQATRVVEVLQATAETGAALAIRLGENLASEVSPLEGRLAVEWAMRTAGNSPRSSRTVAAMSAVLLAGATSADLLAGINSASMVPVPSRSPTSAADAVAAALPSLEASKRCSVAQAIAVSFDLTTMEAARAGALAAGLDMAAYSQVLQTISESANTPESFSSEVAPITGALNVTEMQRVSLAFAAFLERFSWEGDLATPLAAALLSATAGNDVEYSTALLSPLAVCVGAELWELVGALQLALGASLNQTSMVLGQAALATGEAADSPIAQAASVQAAVSRARSRSEEAATLWATGSQYLPVTPSAGLSAWRALKMQEAGNASISELAQKVEQAVLNVTGASDIATLASATQFAAAYAGFSAADATQAVIEASGSVGYAVFLAAAWPAGVPVSRSSSSAVLATSAALTLDQTANSNPCRHVSTSGNETICEQSAWPSDVCAIKLGLHENFTTCDDFCGGQSTVALPMRCLDFAPVASCDANRTQAMPDPCRYATQQDATNPTGICVCSGSRRGGNYAASIVQGLVRIDSEARVIGLLGGVAHRAIAPWAVISAAAQLQAGASSQQIAAAVNIAASSEVAFSISGEQAAYAAHFLASAQGLDSGAALSAAVEAARLRDQSERPLRHLTEVLIFRGVRPEEAFREMISSMLSAFPSTAAAQSIIQGAWWYQLFVEGAVRPLQLSDLRDGFEGTAHSQLPHVLEVATRAPAVLAAASGTQLGAAVVGIASEANVTEHQEVQYAAYVAALQAYLGTEDAAAAVAGATSALGANPTQTAVSLLNYFLASGYTTDQASSLVSTAWQASSNLGAALQSAGSEFQTLFQSHAWQPVSDEWRTLTGLPTGGSVTALGEVHVPYVIQGLAGVLQVTPSQVFLRSTSSRRLTERGFQRRLSELPMCNIDFVVEIRASDDATLIATRIGEFASGSSALYAQFEQAVQQELAAAGLPMPSCFRDAKLAVANVEVVDRFPLPESIWLVSSNWSECPDGCGSSAMQTRSLMCSTGNDFACNASGERPATQQFCENFENCEFDWACPVGGRGSELACGVQILLLVGMILGGFLALWCCCCITYRLARSCRPSSGEMKLMTTKGEHMKVNFYIVDESEPRMDKTRTTRTQESSATGFLKRGWSRSSGASADVKCHVVWDLDVEKAAQMEFRESKLHRIGGSSASQQQALQRLPTALDMTEQDEYKTKQLLREQQEEAEKRAERERLETLQESPAARILSTKSGISASQIEAAIGIGPYLKTDRVEYYSATHCRWVPALIEQQGLDPSTDAICYEVKLASNSQKRAHVPLENLRAPLLIGEPVSAWSPKDSRWHLGETAQPVTLVAYKVIALTGRKDPLFDHLPAHHVWRRFEEGMAVEVYQNPVLGWVSARVARDAEMEDKPYEEAEDKGKPPNWFKVLVEYIDSGMKEDVPAYLVRRECLSL